MAADETPLLAGRAPPPRYPKTGSMFAKGLEKVGLSKHGHPHRNPSVGDPLLGRPQANFLEATGQMIGGV